MTLEQKISAPSVSSKSSYTASLAPFIMNRNAPTSTSNSLLQETEYTETKRMVFQNKVKSEIEYEQLDDDRSWDTAYSSLLKQNHYPQDYESNCHVHV